jgi:hypothetical protein
MWYDALVSSEVRKKILHMTSINFAWAFHLARSTRTPLAARIFFRVRDRTRLQLLLLRGVAVAALQRRGATGPLAELKNSPDPYVGELARFVFAFDHIIYSRDESQIFLEETLFGKTTPLATLSRLLTAFLATQIYSLVVGIPLYYRSRERFFYPPPEPLVLTPTIQPNAPSA